MSRPAARSPRRCPRLPTVPPRFRSSPGWIEPLTTPQTPGIELDLPGDRHDAGGSADDVDDIAFPDAGPDRVPMGVEGADWNRNPGLQAELFGPCGGQVAGDAVGRCVTSGEFPAHAGRAAGQATSGTPRAAARRGSRSTSTCGPWRRRERGIWFTSRMPHKDRCDHVAVLQRGQHSGPFLRVVPEPVEQLRKSPLGRVDAAVPVDGFERPGHVPGS